MGLIFITGIPRSGTTWVGRTFASVFGTKLIHEPFNFQVYPDRKEYWLKYLPAGSDNPRFLSILRAAIEKQAQRNRRQGYRSRLFTSIYNRLSLFSPFLKPLQNSGDFVIKDVHAYFALEYIWEELQPSILVVIRHPCAVANSWAKLGYNKSRLGLDISLMQEKLMEDHLASFREHIKRNDDYFFRVGVFWGLSYFVMNRFAKKYKNWQWVTHESLCDRPVMRFEQLFNRFQLSMNDCTRDFLENNNRPTNENEGPYSVARVSTQEPEKWRTTLTSKQIDSVIMGVEPFGIFPQFYDS